MFVKFKGEMIKTSYQTKSIVFVRYEVGINFDVEARTGNAPV